MAALKKIGNHKVGRVRAAVRKAGDGLSTSIVANGIDSVETGGHYYVLMEVDAKGGKFKVDDDDPRQVGLTFDLEAGVTTFVDKELAEPLIRAQADRNEAAKIAAEEARGVMRFPMGDDADGESD